MLPSLSRIGPWGPTMLPTSWSLITRQYGALGPNPSTWEPGGAIVDPVPAGRRWHGPLSSPPGWDQAPGLCATSALWDLVQGALHCSCPCLAPAPQNWALPPNLACGAMVHGAPNRSYGKPHMMDYTDPGGKPLWSKTLGSLWMWKCSSKGAVLALIAAALGPSKATTTLLLPNFQIYRKLQGPDSTPRPEAEHHHASLLFTISSRS